MDVWSMRSRFGKAASASGAASWLVCWLVCGLPDVGVLMWPTHSRQLHRHCHLPKQSAVGATGLIKNSLAAPLLCPGVWRLTPNIFPMVTNLARCFTQPFCMSHSATWCWWCCCCRSSDAATCAQACCFFATRRGTPCCVSLSRVCASTRQSREAVCDSISGRRWRCLRPRSFC